MDFEYYKYEGTGNDFVMIDNRSQKFNTSDVKLIKHLCDRDNGIGADGFITINDKDQFDFEMKYFNSDGNESTMCGNGGRCIIHMANKLGIIDDKAHFYAIDGEHEGVFGEEQVRLKMMDVQGVSKSGDDFILDTGSPHYVKFVEDVNKLDVVHEGRSIRNKEQFKAKGINVNFVSVTDEGIIVRTYERGVEDETLSCGTGCVASAIAASLVIKSSDHVFLIHTKGGLLNVQFEVKGDNHFSNIWLEGPVRMDHQGTFHD
jgi:diaminopimelate epimerase